MKKPRLLLLAPLGFSIRNILWSGTMDALVPHVELTLATPIHASPTLREACRSRGITIVPMRPFDGSTGGWRMWLRDLSSDNYLIRSGSTANRLRMRRRSEISRHFRTRLRKRVARSLSRAIGFLPHEFWQRFNRTLDTPRDNLAPEREILDHVRPDFVFSTVGFAGVREHPFLWAAHDRRLPIVALVTGFDNLTTKDRPPVPFARYLLWSDHMRGELLRFFPSIDPVTAVVTGTPQFDVYHRADCRWSRAAFLDAIGAKEDLPIVLYSGVAQSGMPREPEGLAQIAQAFADGALGRRVQLVYRPHPKAPVAWYADTIRRFPEMIVTRTNDDDTGDPAKWSPSLRDVQLLVSSVIHSAVNLNITSTMSLDAAIGDLPVVNIAFDPDGPDSPGSAVARSRYQWEHYRGVVESGAVSVCESLEELIAQTRRDLEDRGRLAPQRRHLVETLCGPVDGRSGERVVKALLEVVGVRLG